MFLQRIETYYKTDVLFKFEEIFKEEELALEIPRYVNQVSEKAFKVTVGILSYCAQFAVAGSIRAWLIKEGDVVSFETLEPVSDKAAVQSFVKGRKLVKEKGREAEAITALNMAIEKYDRHAQAYERRAKVNFIMKNYHDALRDYNKCILLDSSIPTAYYGRAKIHIMRGEYEEAIANLEESIKKSIALQTLYWKSRKLKADCHIEQKEWTKAAFDLKLFTARKFGKDDPNLYWMQKAMYQYGMVLLELNEFAEAIIAFDKALLATGGDQGIEEAEILTNRALAKQKAGKTGYIKDMKEAAEKGSKRAKTLLKTIQK